MAESRKYGGYKCAIKCIKKSKLKDPELQKLIVSEMQVLESISHPNLIRTYELLHDDKNFYIVQELAKYDDLLTYLENNLHYDRQPLNEQTVKFIAKQLFSALEYLHQEKGIIHRDVKAENILISGFTHLGEPIIKLTDFGFAKVLRPKEKLTKLLGTLNYMAPEIME